MAPFPRAWPLCLLLCVCFCRASAWPETPLVTRQEATKTAEAYRNFVWTPTTRNIFHGRDRAGIQVDTPDTTFQRPGTRPGWWAPGAKDVGIPYMWGGFSSLQEFAAGIEDGKPAGDVYTAAKRSALDKAVSKEAIGIDCSGLISRCWKLERSYSTRELPRLCDELAHYEELKPGDILNAHNNHVLLFKGWQDAAHTRLYAYEAGSPPYWKVLLNDMPTALPRSLGCKPYRYRLIRD